MEIETTDKNTENTMGTFIAHAAASSQINAAVPRPGQIHYTMMGARPRGAHAGEVRDIIAETPEELQTFEALKRIIVNLNRQKSDKSLEPSAGVKGATPEVIAFVKKNFLTTVLQPNANANSGRGLKAPEMSYELRSSLDPQAWASLCLCNLSVELL